MAGEIQTGFTEQSIGAQIKYMGFKEGPNNVWRNTHEDTTYGVDFKKQEIFKMDGVIRVCDDESDEYLAKIHDLVQLATVKPSIPAHEEEMEVVDAEIVEEEAPKRRELTEAEQEKFEQAGLVAPREQPQQAVTVPRNHEPQLTIDEIKKYVCPTATDQEAYTFLKLCEARRLNPFTKEAYLMKYGGQAATMVVGKDAFTRRAEEHPHFDGMEAGIIVKADDGTIDYRDGTFKLKDEVLLGGWAKVHRKDRRVPFKIDVSMDEYNTGKSSWNKIPATMIRKVALVQALREAFPSDLGGCYDSAEMDQAREGAQ